MLLFGTTMSNLIRFVFSYVSYAHPIRSTKGDSSSVATIMSAIAPPHLRRKTATSIMHQHIESMDENIPRKMTVAYAPTTTRLKSRRPFYNSAKIPNLLYMSGIY